MVNYTTLSLRAAVALVSFGMTTTVVAQNAGDQKVAAKRDATPVEYVHVYGEQGKTTTATNLNLSLFETPQTVTAISRSQMDDFLLDKANEVLDYTPGVTVEEVETHRTYYTARGFDIVNFQYDGVGTPFAFGLVQGQSDTAVYQKIEVVKGAAGLITGLANPSATINYVRKRPTEDLQANARASVNEWNGYRLDGDVSGRLGDGVRGRVVVASEDTESYLDRHEDSTNLFYGVLEFDLSEETLLTVGHSYDLNEADGILWGALPLSYSDGTPTDYEVSTSSAPDWSFRDTEQQQTFVELKHQLSDKWMLSGIYTKTDTDIESELFYIAGSPNPDESGLNAYTGRYLNGIKRDMLDISASGYIELGGREHQLVVGYNHADVEITGASYLDLANGYPALGSDWAKGNSPRPNFVDHDPIGGTSKVEQEHQSFYAAARISFSDQLSALMGARKAEYEQSGVSYGGLANTDADELVPYFGLSYQVTDDVMLYGSHSEVFSPQLFVDPQLRPLGAAKGESSEIGFKTAFNNERAILTVAVFQSEIGNLGVFVGNDIDSGVATYEPKTQESEGYEIELAGQLSDELNISAGYTKVDIRDVNGEVIPYIPEHMIKASASYQIPRIPALKVGGVLKWQDTITTTGATAKQESYALVDFVLSYRLSEQVSAAININNLNDEKYYNSLYWDQAYFGAPRNVALSVSWTL